MAALCTRSASTLKEIAKTMKMQDAFDSFDDVADELNPEAIAELEA
ncbi:hypothetical protein [Microseira wollei]|uniref:Uncharacterized protein n=1 Tax=Microseira wollei NIES-4236 TaxID=2530354 RepID=A0AAV3XQM2_9CYAN|nr:hypothetical protein [Microseira wollei]GET43094.1 hypothetical protein MiSe_79150 [Microseira wollei NIES-4236]